MSARAAQAIAFTRAAASRAITVERVADEFGFNALRHEWHELLHASAADNPFLTWEWLHSWWKHAAGDSALHLLTVRADSQLIAIAPLRMTAGPIAWFSTLEFLGNGGAGSDYLDLIVRRGREADAVRAIARCLRTGDDCAALTAVRFDHVLPQSTASLVAGQLVEQGWASTVSPGGVCPAVHLAGHSWDSYLATLGAAHRANVRRRLRAIDKQFDARFERVTTDAGCRDALQALVAFHQARFGENGSAFLTPELRAFHDEATRRMLERGWLRLYTLRLNGAIAAVMYGFFYNRRFYFFQHGFDDRYKAQSIGLVLMAMTIRAAIDEGADEFDMLWGTEAYKSLWADDRRLLQQIHLFPARVGGRVHRRAIDARRRLGRLARRVLPRGVTSAT
jgi:CelD/BcsL family acetyltransferase involved in cellulose biosynthesis